MTMRFWILVAALSAAQATSWTVSHAWNANEEYTERGVLSWSEEDSSLVLENTESISPDQLPELLEYGWYHVKVENNDGDYVMATVPACQLRRSNWKDEFRVVLPRSKDGQITSLSYTPLVSPLAPVTCDGDLSSPDSVKGMSFQSRVEVELDRPGMTLKTVLPHTKPPPGLTFMAHPSSKKGSAGGNRAAPGAPEEQQQQSFIRKYWYVFLPLFLASFLGPAEPPQASQAPGSGEAAPREPAPVAAAAEAPQSKRAARRGKRG